MSSSVFSPLRLSGTLRNNSPIQSVCGCCVCTRAQIGLLRSRRGCVRISRRRGAQVGTAGEESDGLKDENSSVAEGFSVIQVGTESLSRSTLTH